MTSSARGVASWLWGEIWYPPLLGSVSASRQGLVAGALPVLAGAGCGALTAVSGGVFLAVSLLCMVGGLAAGREHVGWRSGLARGLGGGVLFGISLLAAYAALGSPRTGALPQPRWLQLVITTLLGGALGPLGAVSRSRNRRAKKVGL